MACVNVTDFVHQRQIGNYKYRRQKRHVESFLEEKGLTSLINKECSLSGHCRSTFNMEFSPDGTKVASTHGDHTVRVTDIATGKCVRTLTGHPRTPWCLAYHPSSSHILASGCLDGQVRIWDLYGQGCEVWQTERSTPIASLTFHPVDHVLVFASGKTIYFWDWGRPEPFAQCTTKLEYERVRWVKFDPLGHILYTGISNNTTAQRDEASRVSLMNQRGENQPQHPERLNAMYNNLMNRFQEYRRDRVVNQVQPQLSRQPVQSTSSWDPVADAEMYPGVPDSDIVRPTSPGPAQMLNYARQYAAEVTHRATDSNIRNRISTSAEEENGNFHSDTTSAPPVSKDLVVDFTTESVLNSWENSSTVFTNVDIGPPRLENHEVALNDMLGIEPDASDEATIELVINEPDSNSAGINEHGLDNLSERVNALSAVVDNSDNRENQSAENTISAEQQGVLNRRGMWSPPPRRLSREELTGEVSGGNAEQLNPSNYRDRSPLTQRLGDNVSSESDSGSLHRDQVCLNCRSKQDLNSSNLQISSGSCVPDRNTAATTALKIHPVSSLSAQAAQSLPGSTTNTPASNFPGTPMLTRFLQTQKTPLNKTSSSESRTSAVFPNIRERLQTNIPLTSSDGTHKTGPVRVLASRGEIPVVTVVSASENSATVSSTIDTPRPSYLSRLQTSDTNPTTVRSGLSLATSNITSLSSSHVSRSRMSASARGSEERELSLLNYPPSVPTVIASTSSHASLFQNIYHNSRGTYNYNTRGSFGGGGLIRNTTLTSSRTQPYLQSRSRYGSLMGPYLESRGVGLNRYLDMNTENSAIPSQNTSSVTSRPIIRMTAELNRVAYTENQSRLSQLGPPLSVLNSTTTQYNPLESSDTESELNTHLHNGRYFLPISEDQTRTVSSTSVQSASSVESSETLTTRQRSVSRDSMENGVQGQTSVIDIPYTGNSASDDFVQDMHRLRRESVLERMRLQNNESDLNEVALLNQDDNNNTIHMTENLTNSTQPRDGPEPYLALRNNLVTMTDQIEQEMNELNRRINALRDSFNQSLQALRQDRERYQNLGQSLTDTSTNLLSSVNTTRGDNPVRAENSGEHTNFPVIRVTGLEDSQRESNNGPTVIADPEGLSYPDSTLSQPPTLLETSLRSHTRQRQASTNYQPENLGDSNGNIEPQHWRMLHRHYLHPHYSSSILDETINRPNNAIQSAINRAIAGAFMGTGEAAVANNIINQTHRIQYWDFTKLDIPDITNANQNIVVPHCKLHNDASCDISQNGSLLATFVPSHQGFPDDNILAVYSLEPSSRGQCLYTKSFGPNAISISISPRNNFVMVGLAAKRLSWVFIRNQMVAQIYKFEKENAGEKSMKHVTDVIHPCDMDIRTHISGNAAKWLPTPGHGLVYGTNRGHLRLCRPFCMVGMDKNSGDKENVTLSTGRGPVSRRNLLQMLGLSNSNLPRTISISTQTNIRGIRQSSGTQTDNSDSD